MVGILIAALILDYGVFMLHWLGVTFGFWLVAGGLALTRAQPTKTELVLIGLGPQILFWLLICFPWWL